MNSAESYLKDIYRYESGKQATDSLTEEEWEVIKAQNPISKILEAMDQYAIEAIKKDRRVCLISAKVIREEGNGQIIGIDKSSILDRPLPDLTA